MSIDRGVLLAAAVAALAGCGSAPRPVPVVADALDMAQLEGEWRGEYEAPSVGRSGSIVFQLEAGADTALGDVVMIPRDLGRPLAPAELEAQPELERPSAEVLKIAFVRIEGGRVSGTLEPYRDPECGCPVNTTFTGRLAGDVIEGEFEAVRAGGEVFTGRWRVRRAR